MNRNNFKIYENIHPNALAAVIAQYFYLWIPRKRTIESEIEFQTKRGETGNVKCLIDAQNAGETHIDFFNFEQQEPQQFTELCDAKLSNFLKENDFSVEKDFVKEELERCKKWIELSVPQHYLIKRWIDFLKTKLLALSTLPTTKNEIVMDGKNEVITLLSLSENNDYYNSLIKNYVQKFTIASKFLNKKDFINSEIERITTKYLKASTVEISVDGIKVDTLQHFNFDVYSLYAFNWLSCGEDWAISDIISSAEEQYKQIMFNTLEVVKHDIETGIFRHSIVEQLKHGVSQLAYYKFLKQQLSVSDNPLIVETLLNENIVDSTNEQIKNSENHFLRSTIEDYLIEFKAAFNNESDYSKVIESVKSFFEGVQQTKPSTLFVKNGYSKSFAFALGEIYRCQKNEPISYDFVKFIRDSFSIYKKQDIENKALNKTTMYKYITSKS